MENNLEQLDNELDNKPTNESSKETNDFDGTETPTAPTANLDGAETPADPTVNLDGAETPADPTVNLDGAETPATSTGSLDGTEASTANPDVLDNPDPEYSQTKKMEKIAAIVHNKQETLQKMEDEAKLKEEVEAENKRLNMEFIKLIDKENILNQSGQDGRYISPDQANSIAESLNKLGEEKNRLRQQMIENNARLKK